MASQTIIIRWRTECHSKFVATMFCDSISSTPRLGFMRLKWDTPLKISVWPSVNGSLHKGRFTPSMRRPSISQLSAFILEQLQHSVNSVVVGHVLDMEWYIQWLVQHVVRFLAWNFMCALSKTTNRALHVNVSIGFRLTVKLFFKFPLLFQPKLKVSLKQMGKEF